MYDALYKEYCDNIVSLSQFNVSSDDMLNWLYCQFAVDKRIRDFNLYLVLKSFIREEGYRQ